MVEARVQTTHLANTAIRGIILTSRYFEKHRRSPCGSSSTLHSYEVSLLSMGLEKLQTLFKEEKEITVAPTTTF
jgi:hypothetical protein